MSTINRCQLMRPTTEKVDMVTDLLSRFTNLNKSGKLDIINAIYSNLRDLANQLQETRPDISATIDGILDGHSLTVKNLIPRTFATVFGGNVIEHDSATGLMKRISLDDQLTHYDITPTK